MLDERNVASLNLPTLRAQLGLVTSDPQFFNNKSVAENIAYGDNTREILMDDIIIAAKEACIHDYIITLAEVSHVIIMYHILYFPHVHRFVQTFFLMT